jgi:hypothetical protein
MDIESPKHLDRLRDQPEVKVALLRLRPDSIEPEARFERASKNTLYWPAVNDLANHFLSVGRAEEVREEREFYGRPCLLLATILAPSADAPYAIAIVAADGTSDQALVALLQSVSHDYWFGSSFFK